MLYINFHGGGYPEEDMELCEYIANNISTMVLSMQYRFAPSSRIPMSIVSAVLLC